MRKMYLKEEEHIMCFENDTRYVRQQSAIDDIAGKLGVVSYRPSYHGEKGDANTVLLYTVEDAEHNFQVDRQPFSYTRGEADDRRKFGQAIPDELVYRDHFWCFQNIDVNGRFDMSWGNFGKLDLRGNRWREVLEGSIQAAYAKKQEALHILHTGGWLALREADKTINELNRSIIKAVKLQHGQAFLGKNNFDGEKRQKVISGEATVYEEYKGQELYNFCCDFVVPVADAEIEKRIRQWAAAELPLPAKLIDQITSRVDAIGGANLIWF